MFRRLLMLSAAVLCAALLVRFSPSHAQSISSDTLDAQLLTADAVAGGDWTLLADNATPAPDGTLTAFRVFLRTTTGFEIAGVSLVANPDGSAPTADVLAAAQSGALISQLATNLAANGAAVPVGDFSLLGAQGIGDGDVAAQFTVTVAGTPLQMTGDAWLHGNEIALAFYGGPTGSVDSGVALQQVVALALAQDAKLSAP